MMTGLLFTMALGPVLWGGAETVATPFEERSIKVSTEENPDQPVRYMVLPPAKIEEGKKYPLVLFLHGAGERGDDPALALAHFPKLMATAEYRERFPCFLIVPQCAAGKKWVNVDWSSRDVLKMNPEASAMMNHATAILDRSLEEFPIDRDRVYLTGLSMGGYGSWELAIRRPTMFAAVVPICGGGDISQAKVIAHLPIWAFHGDKDGAVPVERSREMIAALRAAGGEPKYTEFKGVGHDSWTPAYTDPKGVLPWMFEQKRMK